MTPAPLDGNATAGDLTDVFAFDVTTAVTTCANCHHTHPMGTLHAYLQAPGTVLRCALLRRRPASSRALPATSLARATRCRDHSDPPAERNLTPALPRR